MDRAQMNAAMLYLAPPVAPFHDGVLLGRLGAYWRALGVSDPDQIAALSEQALRRGLPDRLESPDPLTGALVAARELLDDWLARTLDLPRQPRALAAARAALLSGAVPDWPAVLFAPPDAARDVTDALRAAVAEPVPAPAPGAMPVQRIELFSLLDPLRRWRRGLSSPSEKTPS
ncbi:MAG: hypothetical protein IPM89_14570 [Candidatus Competibacteraceae bacterium]|nr:MAG: hypothetical protein IPM89_14570 [Candidatus Competibacteraceae bacterium]